MDGLKAGAAMYALDHAARGTRIGQEGGIGAQATRTGGNFVIAAFLCHFLIVPYLIVTAVLFSIPTAVLMAPTAVLASHHDSTAAGIFAVLTVVVFLASVVAWFRYALWRWLIRGLVGPVDAFLSGRPAPRRRGATVARFNGRPGPTTLRSTRATTTARTGSITPRRRATTASTTLTTLPGDGPHIDWCRCPRCCCRHAAT